MQIIYRPGVWDMFHVGHLRTLQETKNLGGFLIVGVPTDEVVIQDKGEPPVIPCSERAEILRSLRCVDSVLIYHELSFNRELQMLKPDILAVGTSWGNENRHVDAEMIMRELKGRVVTFPYHREISSTQIKKKIAKE